jgi:hypothetical protein
MNMNAAELKTFLKDQASRELQERIHNPEYRFTLWSQNGTDFSFEDHAEFDHAIAPRVGECMLKNKTWAAVLDALEDRLYLYSLEIS